MHQSVSVCKYMYVSTRCSMHLARALEALFLFAWCFTAPTAAFQPTLPQVRTGFPAGTATNSEKSPHIVTLYRKYTRPLPIENLRPGVACACVQVI